jgi:RimJ/RimL family protein N-acetyltransferase
MALARWQDDRVTAIRPRLTEIEGRFIRLVPMTHDDLPDLHAAIGHPEVFEQGYGGGPGGYRPTVEGFVAWASRWFPWDTRNIYVVRVKGGEHDGAVIGTSTLGDFDLEREHAHIGWTAYDPRVWGSQVNPEAKLLLLGLAFDSGFGRVKIQTDVLNKRSQAAIARLGATREGVVRRDILRADGTRRDTVVFSIIVDEWPDVRAGLEARLAKWNGEPVQYRERPATSD